MHFKLTEHIMNRSQIIQGDAVRLDSPHYHVFKNNNLMFFHLGFTVKRGRFAILLSIRLDMFSSVC